MSRASWARLIRKVFEVDPLICPNCGAEMKLLAVIAEPKVVDRILARLQAGVARLDPTILDEPPPVRPDSLIEDNP